MKIIAKDNFDREEVADVLIAENIHEHYVHTMVDALNRQFSGEYANHYFIAKPNSYKLWGGMAELV